MSIPFNEATGGCLIWDELWKLVPPWVRGEFCKEVEFYKMPADQVMNRLLEMQQEEAERDKKATADHEKRTAAMYGYELPAEEAPKPMTEEELIESEARSLWREKHGGGRLKPIRVFAFFERHWPVEMQDMRRWVDKDGPHRQTISMGPDSFKSLCESVSSSGPNQTVSQDPGEKKSAEEGSQEGRGIGGADERATKPGEEDGQQDQTGQQDANERNTQPKPIGTNGLWNHGSLRKLRGIDSDPKRDGIPGDKILLKRLKEYLSRRRERKDIADTLYLKDGRIKTTMPYRSMFSDK